MNRPAAMLALALLAVTPAAAQQAAPHYGAPITLDQARRIADAGEQAARERGFAMAFAVVDASGNLVLFHKMDDTQNGSIAVALQKARTSASFRRPTKIFAEGVAGGRSALLSVPDVIAIEGGVPILAGGRVIGGLGVSGGSPEEDGEIAAAALAAAPPAP